MDLHIDGDREVRSKFNGQDQLVNLTDAGRRLREKGLATNLVKASGLTPEELGNLQKGVVTLRNNLIKAAQANDSDPA